MLQTAWSLSKSLLLIAQGCANDTTTDPGPILSVSVRDRGWWFVFDRLSIPTSRCWLDMLSGRLLLNRHWLQVLPAAPVDIALRSSRDGDWPVVSAGLHNLSGSGPCLLVVQFASDLVSWIQTWQCTGSMPRIVVLLVGLFCNLVPLSDAVIWCAWHQMSRQHRQPCLDLPAHQRHRGWNTCAAVWCCPVIEQTKLWVLQA